MGLLNEAERIARDQGLDAPLDRNGQGRVICSARNIIDACTVVDAYFTATVRRVEYRGLRGWLLVRCAVEQFHLGELLGFSSRRWGRAERLFDKWRSLDQRYTKALDAWFAVEREGKSLRDCFITAGLSAATADRRLAELRRVGFSGLVPRWYWLNREALSMTWGADDIELARFNRRVRLGKPVAKLVGRLETRMRPALHAARRGLLSVKESMAMTPVPIVGRLRQLSLPTERSSTMLALPSLLPVEARATSTKTAAAQSDKVRARNG